MAEIRRFRPARSPFDDIMHVEEDGTEWWSAREMMEPLGYSQWRNMENVIEKAISSCRNAGQQPSEHFARISIMLATSNGAHRESYDVQMTRFGCYLLAMNGDPSKPEIAAAQRYFALMTRAAEKAIAVPAAEVQVPRPWSVRFRETMLPHLRYVNVYHPGCFTVVTTLVGPMLALEDELIRHLLRPAESDRPDVSIGLCWANERRRRALPPVEHVAPLRLPDQKRDVELRVYANRERGDFEAWFYAEYLPDKLPEYLIKKKSFLSYGPLPPASAADHTCRGLTGQPARLDPPLRRQLTAVGGFCPVGREIPALDHGQKMLFD